MNPALKSVSVNPAERPGRRIGLLAGAGHFPIRFAEAARRRGLDVVCVGIQDMASPRLAELCGEFAWVPLSKLGRMIRTYKRSGVDRVVMAGKVMKVVMYTPGRLFRLLPDWRMARLWFWTARQNKKDDTILLAVIAEFARDRIVFESALTYCPELLVRPGCLTRRRPSSAEIRDIQFGWDLAKEMGRLDVGQSVAVKEQAVLAVEAIEGTDQAILRAGTLCPTGGFTVVKVAKPQQDMRFDVPTIGTQTIESIQRAGGRVLAIEAGRTILIDEEETVRLADRYGISLVALEPEGVTSDK